MSDVNRATAVLLTLGCGAGPLPTGIYTATQTVVDDTCYSPAVSGTTEQAASAFDGGYVLAFQDGQETPSNPGVVGAPTVRVEFLWDRQQTSRQDTFECDGGVALTEDDVLVSDTPTIEADVTRGYVVPTGCQTLTVPPMTCSTHWHLSYALEKACEAPCGVRQPNPSAPLECDCP